jgi:hypothetical protein
MNDLIEALQIFSKYTQDRYPTYCEHDCLNVVIDCDIVSDEDKTKLEKLGFHAHEIEKKFYSFRFGSC